MGKLKYTSTGIEIENELTIRNGNVSVQVMETLGNKADKLFVPTFTGLDLSVSLTGTVTCDKSIPEIQEAFSNGATIIGNADGLLLQLLSSNISACSFAWAFSDTNIYITGTRNNDTDTWTYHVKTLQRQLTFDEIPTAGSRNPVTSEGIEAYLDARGFHGENLGTVTINQNTYGRSSFHKTINGITYHCAQLNAPSGNWEDGDHLVLSVTRNSGDSAQPLYIISHNFIMAPEGTIVSTGFTGTTIHYTVELSQLLVTQLLALGVPEGSSFGSANIVVNGMVYHKTVHTADIADGAVTEAKISDGSVTSAKIGTGAVTTPKIPDNAVTMAKLAASVRGYFLSEESLMPLLREQAWSLASEETAMYGTGGGFVYVATILSQDLDFPYCKKTLSLRKGQALRITSDRSDYLLGAVVFEDVLAEAEEGVLEYVADDDISVNIITPVDYDDVVNGEYVRTSEEIDRFDNPTESFTIAIYDTVKSLSARLAALEANV